MSQYGMIIDLNRCVGCHACSVACRAEWNVPIGKDSEDRVRRRSWVERLGPTETPKGLAYTYYPGLCNHCDKPSCVEVCPADTVSMTFTGKDGTTKTMDVAATWKDPFDGSVQIDKERCIGCGACAEACPYTARYMNEDGDEPKADKCTFCVERIALGGEPACVQTCLAGARIFGDVSDPDSAVSAYIKKGAVRLESAAVKLGPNVRYFGKERDLYLLDKTSTPQELAQINQRRLLMAHLSKKTSRHLQGMGLLGMAALWMKSKEQDSDRTE